MAVTPLMLGAVPPAAAQGARQHMIRLGLLQPVENRNRQAPRGDYAAAVSQALRSGVTAPTTSGSILEGLARGGEAFFEARAARKDRDEAREREEGRTQALSDALEAMGGDASEAAARLMQSPETAEMGFTLAMKEAERRKQREAEESRFQRQQQARREADDRRFEQLRALQRMDMALAQIKAKQAAKSPALSVGQKKVDETAAKDLVPFVVGGGFADTQKGLDQLLKVEERLAEGDVTGTFVGLTPDFALAPFNQRAVDTQNLVEEVVQRNLRTILGAQFTEKEGQRLIARAYNPHLDEATNLRRVRALRQSIEAAAKAKQEAWNYFQENGTLKGFEGKVWGIQDFNRAIDGAGEQAGNVPRETSGQQNGGEPGTDVDDLIEKYRSR